MHRYTLKQQLKQISLFAKVFIASMIGLCILIGITGFQAYPLPVVQVDLTYLPIIGLFALSGFALWIGFYGMHDYYYNTQECDKYFLYWLIWLIFIGIGILLLEFAILMTGGYILK